MASAWRALISTRPVLHAIRQQLNATLVTTGIMQKVKIVSTVTMQFLTAKLVQVTNASYVKPASTNTIQGVSHALIMKNTASTVLKVVSVNVARRDTFSKTVCVFLAALTMWAVGPVQVTDELVTGV